MIVKKKSASCRAWLYSVLCTLELCYRSSDASRPGSGASSVVKPSPITVTDFTASPDVLSYHLCGALLVVGSWQVPLPLVPQVLHL